MTKETRILKLRRTVAEFNRMAVKDKPGTSRDNVTSDVTFNVVELSDANYRLIHDNVKVITLVDGSINTITSTIEDGAEEFRTEQEALDRIAALGLIYDPA